MIRKVLIAEDYESINISLQKTLSELNIPDIDIVYYCDDALQKIEKNCRAETPYDLLITDLYFEADHRVQQITGGTALISAARKAQPELGILVFSAERKPAIIKMLYDEYQIDGYVQKARRDAEELKTAIEQISRNERYVSPQLVDIMRQQHAYQFTEYDRTILSLLANGVPQKNIPFYLKENKIQPSGLSSVEKRLKQIRGMLKIYKNEQLVVFCKEKLII